MNTLKYLIPLITSVILVGCGGSSAVATSETKMEPAVKVVPVVKEEPVVKPLPVDTSIVFTLSFTPTKAFHFAWDAVPGATSYKIREDINSDGDYQDITTTTARIFDHIVPLYARVNARYVLHSCIEDVCTSSEAVHTSTRLAEMTSSIGYIKASNTGSDDHFGSSVSLSEDGSTLAVGAKAEDSNSTGMNIEDNNSAGSSGAVYVFTLSNEGWSQQAYLKANNPGVGHFFGAQMSLSANGNTLAVGAYGENGSGTDAGATYVFARDSNNMWSEQAHLKASNAEAADRFGYSVSLSANGNTLAVGANGEGGGATEVGGADNNSASQSGAVYVFTRTLLESGAKWTEQTYLKANNTGVGDAFGNSVSLSADGDTLAVAASSEAGREGAVYVFIYNGTSWSYQAYLKADNAGADDQFGRSVSISADGNTLAVSAIGEDGSATGVNNPSRDDGASDSGAAYVFTRSGTTWTQQAYLKANNAQEGDKFGWRVSINDDGDTLAVSAYLEDSDATGVGVNGDQTNNGVENSGAVYTFALSAATWSQQTYIKASNAGGGNEFGSSVALSADGDTLAVGAWFERSDSTGVNADQENSGAIYSGAVYVY